MQNTTTHYLMVLDKSGSMANAWDATISQNSGIQLLFSLKNLILPLLFFVFGSTSLFGQVNPNSTYVHGYLKSNGTYVSGYYRTTPNNTINDNYSTYPNYNPYTGEQGTIQPTYSYPSYSTPTYSYPTYSYPTYSTPSYNYYYYTPYN